MARGLTHLCAGNLGQGFDDYEARLAPQLESSVTFLVHGRRWQPEDDLSGRCLWVIGEQGLGDEILFANVLGDTIEAVGPDGKVVICVEARLVDLFQRSYPTADVYAHHTVRHQGRLMRAVVGAQEASPPDLWVPIASLWRRFRRTADTFPTAPSFLEPDPRRVAHWRDQLAKHVPGVSVGLVWKSLNLDGLRDRYYSAFDLWEPVLKVPGATIINLQYGDTADELALARDRGLSIWTPPDIDLKNDLDDLAALCRALDLFIGIPNATSNIAAAVGTPWWAITAPDAWPQFGTDRYPAYPSAQVFAMADFIQWDVVMQTLAATLTNYVAHRTRT